MNTTKITSTFKMPVLRTMAMALTASVALSACTTERQTRGYMADFELMNAVTPGIDNINSVRDSLGSPSITGTFDDSIWYYVSTGTVTKSIMHEKPASHYVMAITFDEVGIVTNKQEFDLSHIRPVNPVNDKTPTRGRTLGFFEQIFGNIGRFAAPAPGGAGGGGPF